MFRLSSIFFIVFFILSLPLLSEVKWETDFNKAIKKASLEKKDVFAYFTGSDWCSLCKVLKKEVFDKDGFLEAVQKDFVILKIDFPKKKTLSDIEQQRNDKLAADYSVEGFPTVLLIDTASRVFAKTGYKGIPADEYQLHIKGMLKIKAERDKLFNSAVTLEGVEKAKALGKGLAVLGDVPKLQYNSIVEDILKADPDDKSGFKKTVVIKQKLAGLEEQVIRFVEGSKYKEARKAIEDFIKELSPTGEDKQKAMLYKIYTYEKNSIDFDEVEKYLDSIIAINPKTESAGDAQGVKDQVAELRKSKE